MNAAVFWTNWDPKSRNKGPKWMPKHSNSKYLRPVTETVKAWRGLKLSNLTPIYSNLLLILVPTTAWFLRGTTRRAHSWKFLIHLYVKRAAFKNFLMKKMIISGQSPLSALPSVDFSASRNLWVHPQSCQNTLVDVNFCLVMFRNLTFLLSSASRRVQKAKRSENLTIVCWSTRQLYKMLCVLTHLRHCDSETTT